MKFLEDFEYFQLLATKLTQVSQLLPHSYIQTLVLKSLNFYLLVLRKISIEAAYLYDAVHVYARALMTTLDNGEDPYNGSAILQHIVRSVYQSALG